MKVRFSELAIAELHDAAKFYEAQFKELGRRFRLENLPVPESLVIGAR